MLDVLGREIRRELDAFDKSLISETHYDALGRVDKSSRAREGGPQASDFTDYTYDNGGRPRTVELPDGTDLEYCYLNNVRCERDQRGFVSCEVYNTHGRLVHRVEPLAAATPAPCETVAGEVALAFSPDSEPSAAARAQFVTTRYRYYPLGAVLSVTDAAGHVTRFQRDERGEKIRNLIHPDTGTWGASYNAFNELENEISPDNSVSTYHYDPFGRLIERVDQGEISQSTRFNFDFINGAGFFGELNTTVSTDGVEQHFEYDLSGHVTTLTVTDATAGLPQPMVKHIDYDDLQRPSLISYDSSSGAPLSYKIRYNDRGYVAGYDRPHADPAQPDIPLWAADTADNYGLLTALSFGNGVTDTRTYHPGNGLPNTQTLSHGGELQFLSHDYTADHRLQLFTRRDDGTNTEVTRYDYDALKRVKSAVTHDGTESGPVRRGEGYDYDTIGNLTERMWWTAATISNPRRWTYNYEDTARPHAVSSIEEGTTSSQFHYRSDGSMDDRSDGVQGALHIDSNRRHMPSRLVNAAGAVNLRYDAFDHRTRKSTSAGETLYLDDQYSRVKASLTSGSEEHLIVGSEGAAVAEIVRSPSGSDSVSYLHHDGLGSPILVTDASGAAVQRRRYEAFGQHSGVTGTPSTSPRSDFTGQELDAEVGLVNLQARLYDPATGRFLAIDPLIEPRGGSQRLNPYSYVNNDPVNHTDRYGMQCDDGACLPPPPLPPGPQNGPTPPIGTWDDTRQRGGGTGTQQACGELDVQCRPINTPKQAAKRQLQETTKSAGNFHAAAEGLSLGPTGAPVLSAHELEVMQAHQGYMVPNKFVDDVAKQVDQSAEFWRGALEVVLNVESAAGLLKLGVGLAKAGAKYGIVPFIKRLAGSSGEVLSSGALPNVPRIARLTQEGVEHVALRHFPTSGATGAGKFATNSLRELRGLITEAVQKGAMRANTRGRPGAIFELDFGRQIGTNIAGDAATRLRVVVTPDGIVKTAFPF